MGDMMTRNSHTITWLRWAGLLLLVVLGIGLGPQRAEAILTPNTQHAFSKQVMDVASWAVDGFVPMAVQARRTTTVRWLSKRFGCPKQEIRKLNAMDDEEEPERGTFIYLIPQQHPFHERHTTHVVHVGETFQSIAWTHNVCVDDLVSWNWRVDARRPPVGTALRIHRERRRCNRRQTRHPD
ncbi:MAG: LysM domain-containing protein, partial [Myxococcota bacterium]